jgi:HTH-type transcriptional regulator / antitoxin HipB
MNPESREHEIKVSSMEQLASLVVQTRKAQKLTQADIAGLAGTGNRFIVDLEDGKPTIRMGMVLGVLKLLGLELIVRRRGDQ